jgi:hypothetical protein
MNKQIVTIAPVSPGENTNAAPEWCRIRDVERMFGIKRGTCYALIRAKRISSCLLRAQGRVSGLRLISTQSVRDFITAELNRAERSSLAITE